MSGNHFSISNKKQKNISAGNDSNSEHRKHQNSDANIDDLYINSRSGLWGVLIFLAASAVALYYSKHSLASTLPADIMEQLGSTPPVFLINCVFGASTLSSLIIIAGRIYNDREPGKTSTHLWFRMFFYVLYFISGAMGEYFNVVFISGLVVLGLQHYNVWNYYMQAIEANMDKFNSMNAYNSWLSKK